MNRPEHAVYRVGERFYPGRCEWPEGAQLVISAGGPELTIFHRAIGEELLDDVGRGPAEFALIVEQPMIVLAYRFGESSHWTTSRTRGICNQNRVV